MPAELDQPDADCKSCLGARQLGTVGRFMREITRLYEACYRARTDGGARAATPAGRRRTCRRPTPREAQPVWCTGASPYTGVASPSLRAFNCKERNCE